MNITQLKSSYIELKAEKERFENRIKEILSEEITEATNVEKTLRSLARKQRIINRKAEELENVLNEIKEAIRIELDNK